MFKEIGLTALVLAVAAGGALLGLVPQEDGPPPAPSKRSRAHKHQREAMRQRQANMDDARDWFTALRQEIPTVGAMRREMLALRDADSALATLVLVGKASSGALDESVEAMLVHEEKIKLVKQHWALKHYDNMKRARQELNDLATYGDQR